MQFVVVWVSNKKDVLTLPFLWAGTSLFFDILIKAQTLCLADYASAIVDYK
jgi:hypothetical protein